MQLAFIASCHPKRGFCPGLGTLWGCRSRCPNQPPCWPRAAPSRRACPTDSPGFGFLQLPGPSAPSHAPPTRPWNQPWGPPLTLPRLLPGPTRGFPAGTLSAPQTLTRLSTLCRRPAPVPHPWHHQPPQCSDPKNGWNEVDRPGQRAAPYRRGRRTEHCHARKHEHENWEKAGEGPAAALPQGWGRRRQAHPDPQAGLTAARLLPRQDRSLRCFFPKLLPCGSLRLLPLFFFGSGFLC